MTTIAAIATPPGRGGVAVVRVSGDLALAAVEQLTAIRSPEPRHAYFRTFKNQNEPIDEGIVLFFKAPYSYTGEDVAEFHGHAGAIAPQQLLRAILSIPGIQLAEPGEFTKRAFLNGKISLNEAEAVEDLISASSEGAARAALRSLQGKFSAQIKDLASQITQLRARTEACIDFPEEHEAFLESGQAYEMLANIRKKTEEILVTGKKGQKLSSGSDVVLLGAPNSGKSSMLNALAGTDLAIVTAIPGTTRDTLTANLEMRGMPVTLTDTAGLRITAETIEKIGIERALQAVDKADLIILTIDSSSCPPAELSDLINSKISNRQVIIAATKADLPSNAETADYLNSAMFRQFHKIRCSAKTGAGLDELNQAVTENLGITQENDVCSARLRHIKALEQCTEALKQAETQLAGDDLVLCATELKVAHEHLGEITGKVTADDLLGKIFLTFCIGK